MSELVTYPVWKLSDLMERKEIKSEEITRAYLDRIDNLNGTLGAYLSIDADRALQSACEADARVVANDRLGYLDGIPLAIKDVLAVNGMPNTCGSRILEGFVPPFDGTAVDRLHKAGAVFLGKTNCDEFAMGSSNEFSAYMKVKNPWNTDCAPGGSSGGSAAAVAGNLAAAALGTDTGGSVRQPASFCGIVGLKPTYGRVSRYGLVAFGSSLDTIGPMTKCVKDAAILLQAMAGRDNLDATSLHEPVDDYLAHLGRDIKGLRIGLLSNETAKGLDPEVKAAFDDSLKKLEAAGAVISEVRLPHFRYAIPTYYIVACAEASSNLERFDGIKYGLRVPGYEGLAEQYIGTRTAGFGPEVKRRIMLGTFVLSSGYYDAYYGKGTMVRELIKREIEECFRSVDLIATPTSPAPAFRLGEKTDDPIQMYLADIFTVTANLAGIPGVSINCGFTQNKLPIGFQFLAPHLGEARMLQAAYALEQILDLPQDGPSI